MVFAGPVNSVVDRRSATALTDHRQKIAVHGHRSDQVPIRGWRQQRPHCDGKVVPKYLDSTGAIKMLPSFLFWCLFVFGFSYLGTILPIWRFAQPVNYIGFWVTFLTIAMSAMGAVVGALAGWFGNARSSQGGDISDKAFRFVDADEPIEGCSRQHHPDRRRRSSRSGRCYS